MESFLILPIAMSSSFGNVSKVDQVAVAPQVVLSQQMNIEANGLLAFNQLMNQESEAPSEEEKAAAIDAFFRNHDMPLEGKGLKMVQEAEKNGLDWRLVAAISVRESTGGRHACKKVKFNPFGWGSCKIGFKSYDQAIETIARNLGGNNPNTAKHYSGKTTKEILEKYNPPSIVPDYAKKVMGTMDEISEYLTQAKVA